MQRHSERIRMKCNKLLNVQVYLSQVNMINYEQKNHTTNTVSEKIIKSTHASDYESNTFHGIIPIYFHNIPFPFLLCIHRFVMSWTI